MRKAPRGDTTLPKLLTVNLQSVIQSLEWDNIGIKIDGRQLNNLRFVDDIVLTTPSINQTEQMLTNFNNVAETMLIKNRLILNAAITLKEMNIPECSNYVYLDGKLNGGTN